MTTIVDLSTWSLLLLAHPGAAVSGRSLLRIEFIIRPAARQENSRANKKVGKNVNGDQEMPGDYLQRSMGRYS